MTRKIPPGERPASGSWKTEEQDQANYRRFLYGMAGVLIATAGGIAAIVATEYRKAATRRTIRRYRADIAREERDR